LCISDKEYSKEKEGKAKQITIKKGNITNNVSTTQFSLTASKSKMGLGDMVEK
jgi:hypothetical protein